MWVDDERRSRTTHSEALLPRPVLSSLRGVLLALSLLQARFCSSSAAPRGPAVVPHSSFPAQTSSSLSRASCSPSWLRERLRPPSRLIKSRIRTASTPTPGRTPLCRPAWPSPTPPPSLQFALLSGPPNELIFDIIDWCNSHSSDLGNRPDDWTWTLAALCRVAKRYKGAAERALYSQVALAV